MECIKVPRMVCFKTSPRQLLKRTTWCLAPMSAMRRGATPTWHLTTRCTAGVTNIIAQHTHPRRGHGAAYARPFIYNLTSFLMVTNVLVHLTHLKEAWDGISDLSHCYSYPGFFFLFHFSIHVTRRTGQASTRTLGCRVMSYTYGLYSVPSELSTLIFLEKDIKDIKDKKRGIKSGMVTVATTDCSYKSEGSTRLNPTSPRCLKFPSASIVRDRGRASPSASGRAWW